MRELEQKGHNTPVKWINQEKNTILTKQEDGLERAHHNASGTKE